MPNLLALSFEGQVAPSFDLKCLREGHKRPDGWGLGYYPGGEPSASVLKEPAPPTGSIRSELVRAWEHLESSVFLLHVRAARWGSNTDANTQPFARHHGGREWLFAHSGSLDERIELTPGALHEPVGSTDTESLFCEILNRLAARGWKRLGDADPEELAAWFRELNELGSLSSVLTDGLDLCVWADQNGVLPPHVQSFYPPYQRAVFGDDDVEIDLTRRGAMSRRGVLVSSSELRAFGDGRLETHRIDPGQLILVRGGVVHDKTRPGGERRSATGESVPVIPVRSRPTLPPAGEASYRIRHRTSYRYEQPVERSSHVLRLSPIHDRHQEVRSFDLQVSVPHVGFDFEDVFGNRTRRLAIDAPYEELVIEATSIVDVHPPDFDFAHPRHERATIPLVWMPWQRHMLAPYMLPPEIYETELAELTGYAMNFVRRNDSDLLATLTDINRSIHREYLYAQGATNLSTTAFDVYASRKGVCQDFANLFICLARLLGAPARYVCGYVHVDGASERSEMGLASHAWAEVYLPDIGWRGFDPTNGSFAEAEHVRVAIGRTYRDATPTSGTLFVGGGPETLAVAVGVERLDDVPDLSGLRDAERPFRG